MLTGKTINQLSPIDQVYSDLNLPSEYDGYTYKVSFDQLRKSISDYITGVTPSATATIPVTPTPSNTPCFSKCRQYNIINSGPNQAIVQYIDCDGNYQFLAVTGNSTTIICSSIYPDYSYTPDPSGDYVFEISAGTCCFSSTPTPTPTPTKTPTTTPTPTPNLGLLLRDCCNQNIIGYLSPSLVSQNQLSQGVYYISNLSDITGSTISGGCYSLEFGNTTGILQYSGYSNVSSFIDCQTCLNLTGNYLDCSSCPTGYTWSPYTGTTCISIDITGSTQPTGTQLPILAIWDDFTDINTSLFCGHIQPWNSWGSILFDTGYDINGNGSYQPIYDGGTGLWNSVIATNYVGGTMYLISPLQRSGVWASLSNPPYFQSPNNWSYFDSTNATARWFGIVDTIESTGQTFYVGICGPTYCLRLNGNTILQTDFTSGFTTSTGVTWDTNVESIENSNQWTWKIYPVYFPAGLNTIELLTTNMSGLIPRPVFGCEIYDNSYQEIFSATQISNLNIIYSTINRAIRIADYPNSSITQVPPINCFDTTYPICFNSEYDNTSTLVNIDIHYWDCNADYEFNLWEYYQSGSSFTISGGTSGSTPQMLVYLPYYMTNAVSYSYGVPNIFTLNPPDTGFTNFNTYHGFGCPSGYYYDRLNDICVRISYCEGQQSTGTTCVTPTPTPTPLPPTPTPTSYSGVCSIVVSSNCGVTTATTQSYINGYPSYSFSFPYNPQTNWVQNIYWTIEWDGIKWIVIEHWNNTTTTASVLLGNNLLPIGSTTQWVGNIFSNTSVCVLDYNNFFTYGLYNNCPTPTPSTTPPVTPTPTSCFGCREWYYNNQNAFNVTLYYSDCYSGQQSTILSGFTTGYTECILNNPWHNPLPPNSSLTLLPIGNCCSVSPTPTPTPTVTPTETNKG